MKKSKLSLATFGVILGVAGIEHGIGEISRGRAKVLTNMFLSWPDNDLYRILGGEPAFSLFTGIPFIFLGILSILFSCLLIFCALFFLQRKFGTLCFLILNVCMFLFGAGFAGPIILGIPITLFSIFLKNQNITKERSAIKKNSIRFLFYSFYSLSVLSWLLLWPGFVIISSFHQLSPGFEPLVYAVSGMSLFTFLASVAFGFIYDRTA